MDSSLPISIPPSLTCSCRRVYRSAHEHTAQREPARLNGDLLETQKVDVLRFALLELLYLTSLCFASNAWLCFASRCCACFALLCFLCCDLNRRTAPTQPTKDRSPTKPRNPTHPQGPATATSHRHRRPGSDAVPGPPKEASRPDSQRRSRRTLSS